MQRPNIHEGVRAPMYQMYVTCWVTPPTVFVRLLIIDMGTVLLMTVGTLPVTRACSVPQNKPSCDQLPGSIQLVKLVVGGCS